MSHDFEITDEAELAKYGLDEYDPVDKYEYLNAGFSGIESGNSTQALESVSNDDFMAAIFGSSFVSAYPLVCKKSGDPNKSGWPPLPWPCDTSDPDQNWYTLPSLYKPDETSRYRAKKNLAISVYAVMVDDVGTKVSADRFVNCPPSWEIETSPGNSQYGYILAEPITDVELADKLKEKLIDAGLCDSGATGGAARWMRLPVATNGRPKYGNPSPKCRLVQWRPGLKYTVEGLYSTLGLQQAGAASAGITTRTLPTAAKTTDQLSDDAEPVVNALKVKGLYKNPIGLGKHDITCPWVGGHTDSIDNGSAYFEPSQKYPSGGFKCHHSHGHLFHIGDLKKFLGLEDTPTISSQTGRPQKLPPALRPVLALDLNHLPDVMRDAVLDLADRLQCPPDYLAVAMLSAAGAVVGNKVGIFPYANDESWEVYPALWGGIVGDPGTKKTPSLLHAHKPLNHLESQAAQKYASDMQAHKQAMLQHDKAVTAWSKNKGTSLKPTPPVEPKRTRYVVHDSTYQALGVILADNPRGVLALADELSGLLQSLDTAGQEAARGFYLTGWSGTGGYSFDRVGRGSITLDRYCLSVFGGFQPDRVKAYVQFTQRGSSKNDGLLQRFQLLVWPDSVGTFKFVDRPPNQAAISKYQTAILSLPKLTDQKIQGARYLANGSQLLHFTPIAQNAFNAWYVENETMLATGGLDSARQSHFAKYRSLLPALALLFHLLDGHSGPVCDKCLNRALSYSAYLKSHADRIYASVSGHDHAAVRLLAERLLSGKLADGFSCRTLTLKGWSSLTTRDQAQAAIDALVEYGWLIESEIRTGGRPSVVYTLNPDATADLL
jgi:hypothetical protein